MRIAQVAPLVESVPPSHYGGTERVVAYLTEGLVRHGHDVTLFASGDSRPAGRLVAAVPEALRRRGAPVDGYAIHLRMLLEVYERASEFDVIHLHTGYVGLPLTRTVATPTVVTLHGRLDVDCARDIYGSFPDTAFVSISDAQRRPLPDVAWARTIHHGVPSDLYRFEPRSRRYLLFLGRISPEKGPDAAIRVAREANLPLVVAAKVDRVDRGCFERTVRPLMEDPLVTFVGEVHDEAKQVLLGNAAALLFPVDWPEPFGLVLIEALACGTPVIARRRGSVPEILAGGETGFLCDTEAEMADAARRISTIDRAACRAAFDARFTAPRMVEEYVTVYERVVATAAARRAMPGAEVREARQVPGRRSPRRGREVTV